MRRTFLFIFSLLSIHFHLKSQDTYYYYPAYHTFYSVENEAWIHHDNNRWVASHTPPVKMPVIRVQKNQTVLFTYNGPNPFLYHITLRHQSAKQTCIQSPYSIKIKTQWGSSHDSVKIQATYTGRAIREFNK
jgi:hypothetical protein